MSLVKISKSFNNLSKVLSKNSPTIMTFLGVGGVVTTAIFTYKGTIKALEIIKEAEYEDGYYDEHGNFEESRPLTNNEILRLTWRCYVPAGTIGLLTVGCILGANHENLRRNAALASAYSLTEAAFKEYKTKVTETIGSAKEQKVCDDVAADRIKNNPASANEIILTSKGDSLCYDSLSGRYFKSDIEKIRKSVNNLNAELLHSNFVTLNEFYWAIGLNDIRLGENVGWDVSRGIIELRYSSQLADDGTPCLVLDYSTNPKEY